MWEYFVFAKFEYISDVQLNLLEMSVTSYPHILTKYSFFWNVFTHLTL